MSRTESPLSSIKKWGCVAPESNVKSVSSLAPSQRPRIGKKCDASPELKIIKKWNIKIIREPRPVEKIFEKKLKYIFWSQQGKTKKTIIVSELEWINFEKSWRLRNIRFSANKLNLEYEISILVFRVNIFDIKIGLS